VPIDGRQGVYQLMWRSGLLEEIRAHVGENYTSRSGMGTDVGGVLYGQRVGEVLHVLAWRPMLRSVEAAANFTLNGKEERHLKALLAAPRADGSLRGMEALGWFRSRMRGELALETSDIALHEKHFTAPAHLLMIVKPSHQRPASAAVYLRDAVGLLRSNDPAGQWQIQPGPIAMDSMRPSGHLPEVSIQRQRSAEPWNWGKIAVGVLVAAILVFGTVSGLQWNKRRVETAAVATIQLQASVEGGKLRASWNPAAKVIAEAGSAQLHAAGQSYDLSAAELKSGSRAFELKSAVGGDIEVRLVVGGTEESTRLILAAQ
jgi:hypothetical protein